MIHTVQLVTVTKRMTMMTVLIGMIDDSVNWNGSIFFDPDFFPALGAFSAVAVQSSSSAEQ